MVLSVDIEEACITEMSEEYKELTGLEWAQVDLNDADAMEKVCNGRKFDFIVDKATLEALLCELDCSGYMQTVTKYLKCGGVYMLVSLYGCNLLDPLLKFDYGRPLKFSCEQFTASNVTRSFVTLQGVRACEDFECGCSFDKIVTRNVIRDHFQKVLDWYHREESPLLSIAREKKLRSDFSNALSSQTNNHELPLEKAYQVMFSFEERQDFSFDDFLADINANTSLYSSTQEFTISDAIAFLKANQ